jgi:hypothetical protein
VNTIAKPSKIRYRQLIVACASDYTQARTLQRKQRILTSLDQLECFAAKYDILADCGSLETLAVHTHCGNAEKDDLIDLYNSKFVPEGRPGRKTYLAIRQSAPMGRCPLCSQLPVSTVDHYLPKSKYPAISVFPRNLVPACGRCNEYKIAKADALTLHPYYDNVETVHWLKCVLFDGEAISVKFDVWEDVEPAALRQRMVNHLYHVGVGELYQASALSHLADTRHRLCEIGKTGGSAAVHAYLQEEYESRRVYRLNSWGTALYSALCKEEWFIQGGYVRIEHD